MVLAKFLFPLAISMHFRSSVLVAAAPQSSGKGPYIINLRREVVPVYRNNEVVSYKTSHSGILHIGNPQQEFRVVFDTGSGHVVLPSAECRSEACLEHKRYNVSASPGAVAINVDGSRVPKNKLCDQVTIGFGTGSVTGEFVKEQVCILKDVCIQQHMVMAVEMSVQPFKSFAFDGILGLGLSKLSLSPSFSFLTMMQAAGEVKESYFGVYLSEGENGEESELTLGGTNTARYTGPLKWTSVAKPGMGHWQVAIKAVRIGNMSLSACNDGSCRGIVDTGTSHLGIPGQHVAEAAEILTVPVGANIEDCRMARGLTVEIDLEGFTLVLYPKNYMRRLPLRDGVNVGSTNGVSLTQDVFQSADDFDHVEEDNDHNANRKSDWFICNFVFFEKSFSEVFKSF